MDDKREVSAALASPPAPPLPPLDNINGLSPCTESDDPTPQSAFSTTLTAYLLISPAPPYTAVNVGRAHWRIFIAPSQSKTATDETTSTPASPIPTTNDDHNPPSTPGTALEVIGNPFDGFFLHIARDYSPSTLLPHEKVSCITLSAVNQKRAVSEIESIVRTVKPPRRSENPLNGEQSLTCQSWTSEVVGVLVEKGVLDEGGVGRLEWAKKRFNSKRSDG